MVGRTGQAPLASQPGNPGTGLGSISRQTCRGTCSGAVAGLPLFRAQPVLTSAMAWMESARWGNQHGPFRSGVAPTPPEALPLAALALQRPPGCASDDGCMVPTICWVGNSPGCRSVTITWENAWRTCLCAQATSWWGTMPPAKRLTGWPWMRPRRVRAPACLPGTCRGTPLRLRPRRPNVGAEAAVAGRAATRNRCAPRHRVRGRPTPGRATAGGGPP